MYQILFHYNGTPGVFFGRIIALGAVTAFNGWTTMNSPGVSDTMELCTQEKLKNSMVYDTLQSCYSAAYPTLRSCDSAVYHIPGS